MKHISHLFTVAIICITTILSGCKHTPDTKYSRGIGIYPGNPDEDFSPCLVVDNSGYRNIAKFRSACHSSSFDYNLTAQLVTDGIIDTKEPPYITLTTHEGTVPKNEQGWLFDENDITPFPTRGNDIFFLVTLNNYDLPIDKISLRGNVIYNRKGKKGYSIACLGSNDGNKWEKLWEQKGHGFMGDEYPSKSHYSFSRRIIDECFSFKEPVNYKAYKIAINMPAAEKWSFSSLDFYLNDKIQPFLPAQHFSSSWMSDGKSEEWVYIDLGGSFKFDKVDLYWVNKAVEGSIQVSDDAENWKDIQALPGGNNNLDEIKLHKPAKGRYVRILMKKPNNDARYVLSEVEIFGKEGLVAKPKKMPSVENNKLYLSGGEWKLQRSSLVKATGKDISQKEFDANSWIAATVPGTVLSSYINTGAVPNPNFADNQFQISESFFQSDFWYRDEFSLPAEFEDEKIFLNFDGINWKAEIYLNGSKLGHINGAFMRKKFDVTGIVKKDDVNVLAVKIIKNAHPGAVKEQTSLFADWNGGVLGADNPTFHASIGWDWIPTVRGRNMGIWNDVYLSSCGTVSMEDPFIRTELPLPDTSTADIFVEVTLKNNAESDVSGQLKGKYGDIEFNKDVTLLKGESKTVKLNPSSNPELKMKNPKLWWPNGYGSPNLYDVDMSFLVNGKISDKKTFKSGVRQVDFNEDNGILSLFVNGRRFIGFGGSWGFSESNLNYRAREYDIAVQHHANMNFTMIRNWVGQTGDEEFYEACDRHGIMVWNDFWLANPVDGPNPDDPDLFMSNVEDYVKRIRNHPSIGIYVGRNEGNPPEIIDTAIRSLLPVLHPGIHYISSSADGVVSGHGPYRALNPKEYFSLSGNKTFHSERGMPNVMTYESMLRTFDKDALWPQNSQWGVHDFTLESAQRGESFNKMIENGFGKPQNAKQFSELAQWINYNGYRAIFESRSDYRKGMLLWMSHSAWPSMVWQTYDYYFEPTAAYFGCKKACEPIHIQWNLRNDTVEVVNYRASDRKNLTAKAEIRNMDGSIKWQKKTSLNSTEDSTVECFKLDFPNDLSAVYFVKLTLTENGNVISENFYWSGVEEGNYKALNDLPKTSLLKNDQVSNIGNEWKIITTLKNESKTPALMIRLKVSGEKSGERILPVFYSDNYFFLMPGEEKVVTMTLHDADTRGEKPKVELSGFNI